MQTASLLVGGGGEGVACSAALKIGFKRELNLNYLKSTLKMAFLLKTSKPKRVLRYFDRHFLF
jgi:hypothetical protein